MRQTDATPPVMKLNFNFITGRRVRLPSNRKGDLPVMKSARDEIPNFITGRPARGDTPRVAYLCLPARGNHHQEFAVKMSLCDTSQ